MWHRYGDGTARLTVEQNILFPNIPNERLEALKQDPLCQKYKLEPPPLTRGLVSCTGAQFCGVAIIETKNRAMELATKLEEQLDFPEGKAPRLHWTGCPNSCGQVQTVSPEHAQAGGGRENAGVWEEGGQVPVGQSAWPGTQSQMSVSCACRVAAESVAGVVQSSALLLLSLPK